MLSQPYYLIRSRADGQYLVARSNHDADSQDASSQMPSRFLLLFQEHADALSYLNAHASGLTDRFAVESVPSTQVGSLLKRWEFTGIGLVQDPLIPQIEFLVRN
jgi:hypothetical protein